MHGREPALVFPPLYKFNISEPQNRSDIVPYAENRADRYVHESMAEHLASALRKEGYQCDIAIGKSDFRIDVAVLDKKHPGKYKLGILFDGRSYYRSPMMRDREIIQPKVLQGLGWSLLRVWQTDYFRNPNETLRQICQHLQNL